MRLHTDGVDPSDALEAGFLESSDDGITFSDPEVRHDYLVRHTASLALQAWDDAVAFANVIWDVHNRTSELASQREVLTVVLLVLARDHGKDVVGRIEEVARPITEGEGGTRFLLSFYHAFCESLPELPVEPHKLADTLEPLLRATDGDLAQGRIIGAVEKLASRSRPDADALYEVFASRPNSRVAEFTVNALVGLARFDLPEAHRRTLSLTAAEQPTLRRAGVGALGHFDYAGANPDLLETTWKRLEALRAYSGTPEVDQALARSYGNLLHQKEEATEALVEFSSRSAPVVQIQVASILDTKADEARGEPWFRTALLNLARVATSHASTWQVLDHCAASCAEELPDLVFEFMEAVVIGRDYGAEGKDAQLPKLLMHTISALVQHPEALEAAVTRWFASTERRLHRAATDVVHNLQDLLGEQQPWLRLSKSVLDTFDEQTVLYMVQRIMGHVVTSRPLAALLLSAVRREPCSPALSNFVSGALAEYVLYNYPNEAGGYLRDRIESGEASDTEAEVAKAALDHWKDYSQALHELPRLKEFEPSSRRLYLLRLAEHKQQAAMMEEVRKQSVVMSLATRVPLKYGRGFFMEREGEFTEPSNLSSFSHSVEMPRGALINPIVQEIQRIAWQFAGLREDQGTD